MALVDPDQFPSSEQVPSPLTTIVVRGEAPYDSRHVSPATPFPEGAQLLLHVGLQTNFRERSWCTRNIVFPLREAAGESLDNVALPGSWCSKGWPFIGGVDSFI